MSAWETALKLTGLRCAGCVAKLEKSLLAVPGVTEASVNLAECTALVFGTATAEELLKAVDKVGFSADVLYWAQNRCAHLNTQYELRCLRWQN